MTFRLTAPEVPEDDLHEQVAEALNVLLCPEVEWTSMAVGHIPLPARWAAKLFRIGVKRSWPDIILLHHDTLHGIELKRAGATLSRSRWVRTHKGGLRRVEGQREVFPRLERAGMRIAVCRNLEQVLAACDRWAIPTRGRIAA